MSFSEEPFAAATIVFNGDATMELRCNSCGGGWQKKFPEDATLFQFQEWYYKHLEQSHDLKPKCGFTMNIREFTLSNLPANGFLKCTLDGKHTGNHHLEMVNQ